MGNRKVIYLDDALKALRPIMRKSDYFYEILKAIQDVPPAQPEIIRCKDCKHYGRADKRRFYRGGDCLDGRIKTIVPDRDFCSKAERRTDG